MINIQIMAIALIASYGTYYLAHRTKQSSIRISCLLTILCYLVLSYLSVEDIKILLPAFFGGSFTGMSDRSRLGVKRLFLATLLFSIVYIFILPTFKGAGGGLGAAAFVASIFTYIVNSLKTKTAHKLKQKKNT